MRGFTLIEILMVIAAMSIIAVLIMPVGFQFYRAQLLDETTYDILNTIRKVQQYAISQKNDSAFGMKFFATSTVLFQGSSYASRIPSEDETYVYLDGVAVSGINEIVFAKLTGIPNASSSIVTLTIDNDVHTITINSQGKIER